MDSLLREIRACTYCAEQLPLGPAPLLQASSQSKILIAGQAPGRAAHQTGIPWNDPSGDRLRRWLNVSKEQFYDPALFALVPMGFCYPGKSKSGDLPPRKECSLLFFDRLIPALKNVSVTLLCGQYAHSYYLAQSHRGNLTRNVEAWRDFAPSMWPLPHPSPRNQAWFKRHPWFENELLPRLRDSVRRAIETS